MAGVVRTLRTLNIERLNLNSERSGIGSKSARKDRRSPGVEDRESRIEDWGDPALGRTEPGGLRLRS